METARRLDIPADRCIVLDDADAGVDAALSAGMTVLQIPDQNPASGGSKAPGHFVLASLHEVPTFLQNHYIAGAKTNTAG